MRSKLGVFDVLGGLLFFGLIVRSNRLVEEEVVGRDRISLVEEEEALRRSLAFRPKFRADFLKLSSSFSRF